MERKSFMENLMNAPRDAMKEVKGALTGKPKEAAPVDRQAEITKKYAPMYAEDRRRSEEQAAEIRRQIDESLRRKAEADQFFGQPSLSERSARVVTARDTSPQPVSLERARLLQQREALLQLRQATRDARQRKDAEARLAQIDDQLRKAA